MILLADFNPILPEFGQFFWTTVMFILVWIVLGRVAFKPIAKALGDREKSINDALQLAEQTKKEMAALRASNDAELARAREESGRIIKEAKVAADGIVNDAKTKAKDEASRILNDAQQEIMNQKTAAITEVKNSAGHLAVDLAQRLLQRELSGTKTENEAFVSGLIKDIHLN
jgi:F-type H+-transporting ATPase subunit b